ncbi:MAG TPA: MBL fold metallo-hydrolase [Actinophytocola sp.]|uniref:MBL fold metallo-hydrolase n=1 Tax=Actinophytocola sp. TaxID=1872138 RepID=UPI002DF9C2A3|nr:MBL fold metallo-hydrolase [Actinophytocola sp.]
MPTIEITATPCRHGPPLSRPVAGAVIGFALAWPGQEHGVFWISGDTVLYDGVRRVADRLQVDVALLHLGAVRFGLTGPVRYSMTAADAIELATLIRPRTAIPVHHEGWSHFTQGRAGIEQDLAHAPKEIRDTFHFLEMGTPTTVPS